MAANRDKMVEFCSKCKTKMQPHDFNRNSNYHISSECKACRDEEHDLEILNRKLRQSNFPSIFEKAMKGKW